MVRPPLQNASSFLCGIGLRPNKNILSQKIVIFATMKRFFKYSIYALITAPFVMSCAKEGELPFLKMQQLSFYEWVTKNAPQATPFIDKQGVKYEDIYVQYKKRGTDIFEANRLKTYDWFYFDYTGYTLAQDIFTTRDSTTARTLGTWENTTHWYSDFLQYTSESNSLSNALYKVVEVLNPGDELRVYSSAYQGFRNGYMNINSGYMGSNSDYSTFPIYMDIKMGSIVKLPQDAELDSVNRYAKKEWNQTINDTIVKGIYMRKLREMPNGYAITEDTSVRIFYTQRFLDNFMIKTNSDSIAKSEGRYVNPSSSAEVEKVSYYPLQFIPSKKNSPVSVVLNRAVLNMKKGEIADVITISSWSDQGNSGTFSTTPQVLPFQPTLYTIRVLTDKENVGDNDGLIE